MTEWFTIVDALWVLLHKQTEKGKDIIGKVAERDSIFIPVVVYGHWVFWTKTRQKVSKLTNIVVFCDPLNNVMTGNVQSLVEIVISSKLSNHTTVSEG